METLTMQYLNKRGIPMELILVIGRYMWMQQPSHLLDDIKHYSTSLTEIVSEYHTYWDGGQYLNWLGHDIIRYANDARMMVVMNPINIRNTKTLINLFWGLLTIEERDDFISKRWSM
jgi:hypothetical protein